MMGELLFAGLVIALLAVAGVGSSIAGRLASLERKVERLVDRAADGEQRDEMEEALGQFLQDVRGGLYPALRREDPESKELEEIRSRYAGRDSKLY